MRFDKANSVYRRTALFGLIDFKPPLKHIITFESKNGDKTNYTFAPKGHMIQTTNGVQIFNFTADLNKLIKISFQNEQQALESFNFNFVNSDAEVLFELSAGMQAGTEFAEDLGTGFSPIQNNSVKISNVKGVSSIGLDKLRKYAVKEAWRLEKEMIIKTGRGTREWTEAEMNEIIKTGKVKGYAGHHINDVNNHPELAGNPDNIEFLQTGNTKSGGAKKGSEHYNKHHTDEGKKINKTKGKLIKRTGG